MARLSQFWAGLRAGPHLPLLRPLVGCLQEGSQVCPDRGAALLSLKDQPIEDEQEGLGKGSASCPEPDPSLSIPVQPGGLPGLLQPHSVGPSTPA